MTGRPALALGRPPLVPELELWLFAGDVEAAAPHGEPPYWAFCWAAGQLLARHVLEHPELVRGRRVWDFGAGSAIVALAAARAGGAPAIACDRDPLARAVARRNARHNGLPVRVAAELPPPSGTPQDVVLAADVCYERGNWEQLSAWAEAGALVLLADPGRRALPIGELRELASGAARTFPELDEPTAGASVYALAR